MPFHADIEKWCDLKPDANAVSIGDDTISFRDLIVKRDELICRINATEMRQSLHPFEANVIALIAENSAQFFGRFLAATHATNCCLLLSSALKTVQIQTVCGQICPDLVFPHTLFDGIDPGFVDIVSVEDGIVEACSMGENDDSAETPFLIGLTSGTTSQPKAFIRSRLSWNLSLERSRVVFRIDEHTTTISPGPLAHGLSLYAMVETLSAGAHFISMEKFDAAGVIKLAKQHDASRLVLVPTMLSALCNILETGGMQLDQVTSIVTAGSKLDGALLARIQMVMPNAHVFEYYGASELGFVTYAIRHSGDDQDVGQDVGQAFPEVELLILDEHGQELPSGQLGKVCIKSDLICDGYVSHQDGVGFTYKDGLASVGDIGSLDGIGRLTLAGRQGDMVISGGNNIYPSSVEVVLAGVSDVENVSVLGIDDRHLGSKLIAIVSGRNLLKEDLLAHCQQNLPSYAIPKAFYAIQTWPMTESGKVSKNVLIDWVSSNNDQLQQI